MAAGDNPFMVSGAKVTWELEATRGTAPASGAWNGFGPRVGDLRDLGPTNTWMMQRAWQGDGAREATHLDHLLQDYGGTLGEFKLQDPKVLGFAWGEETARAQIGATAYYRHTLGPSTNATQNGMTMSIQLHDEDGAGNATRQTVVGNVMSELEIAGGEGGEVTYAPTFVAQKEDTTVAENTVTPATTASFKHFHGYVEVFGQQLLRIISWRFRKISNVERYRYWNSDNSFYASEYPLQDVNYVFSVRATADGKQFSGFGSRDIAGLARNGDIGKAAVRFARTVDQDEGKIVMGSSDDALGIIGAPRVRPAGGGRVTYDIDFVCRTSTYQYVDTSNAAYFPT